MTVFPNETWPSPPMQTMPLRRTERIVVAWACSIGARFDRRAPDYGSALPARARVGLVVYFGEVLKIKVGVDLRRRDTRVAKQVLNTAHVLAGLEDMGGEGMAEHVRVDVDVQALVLR